MLIRITVEMEEGDAEVTRQLSAADVLLGRMPVVRAAMESAVEEALVYVEEGL